MSTSKTATLLFYVAAVYNFLVGAAFLLASAPLFEYFKVTPPQHPGYIQYPSLVMLIFGAMFVQIGRKPEKNHNLIPYAIALKLASVSVIMWHWFVGNNMPDIWKPFAVLDLVFLIAMIWVMNALAKIMAPMKTY